MTAPTGPLCPRCAGEGRLDNHNEVRDPQRQHDWCCPRCDGEGFLPINEDKEAEAA